MKFKVDENMPPQVATALTNAGHDASTVADQSMSGASDAELASTCQAEGRVILSLDAGFADIRAYPPEDYPGIVVLRLTNQSVASLLNTLARLLPLFEADSIYGVLWIVEDSRVRIRG